MSVQNGSKGVMKMEWASVRVDNRTSGSRISETEGGKFLPNPTSVSADHNFWAEWPF